MCCISIKPAVRVEVPVATVEPLPAADEPVKDDGFRWPSYTPEGPNMSKIYYISSSLM